MGFDDSTAMEHRRGRNAAERSRAAGRQLLNGRTEAVNRVLGTPGLVQTSPGSRRRKRLRVHAFVAGASPRLATERGGAARDRGSPSRGAAASRRDLKREANTELFWANGRRSTRSRSRRLTTPSTSTAAAARGSRTSARPAPISEPSSTATRTDSLVAAAVTGYGEPIGVFVVRDIAGKAGCSICPLSDYVTVDRVRGELIAHELGHSCGLWHTRNAAT